MENGFTAVDWESWNGINAAGRLIAKIISRPRYQSRSGALYEFPYSGDTDYASTPREVWGVPLFLIPTGWWALATAFHDAAYRGGLLLVNPDGTTTPANLDRHQCDDLLLEMMQSLKPNATAFEKAQMDAIFIGVTVGGWHAFKEDRS